jgi:hypothetical protein
VSADAWLQAWLPCAGCRALSIRETVIDRYALAKTVWELVLERGS